MAIDHGQYPWGRSKSIGIMSTLCKRLYISRRARNTCLPLHLTIALVQNDVISLDTLVTHHGDSIKLFMESRDFRDADNFIPRFLRRLALESRVCVVIIRNLPDGSFQILDKTYGTASATKLFIVHSKYHFFIAEPMFASTSNTAVGEDNKDENSERLSVLFANLCI